MEYPPTLSEPYKQALKRGKINGVIDLFTKTPSELSKSCRVSPSDVKAIINAYTSYLAPVPCPLQDVMDHNGEQKFTTGDEVLDRTLGGGIRTGMLWEFVGESASGKTQLALQLSLLVQLPPTLGGISGSACYITTQTELETRRLATLCQSHPLLSPSVCNLDNIQTLKVPTTALLLKVLQDLLPRLIESNIQAVDKKPVKLIVIDSIADLFLSLDKTSSATLAERSKSLAEISTALHGIARKHQISVVVLNKTSDVFHWWTENADLGAPGDLIYHDQSRWFSRADSIHEERQKEASLGLVWANQVNVRIMFTRTSRRKHVDEISGPRATKRQRIEQLSQTKETSASVEQETMLLRRLSVVFSSVSVPNSIDFIISEQGISAPMDLQTVITPPYTAPTVASTAFVRNGFDGIAPLDVGAADTASESLSAQEAEDDGSEWDILWKEDDEFYQNLDLHA